MTKWDTAIHTIENLANLEPNWGDEGEPTINKELIQSCVTLSRELEKLGLIPPNDVYPLRDGCIILEWQLPDGIIFRAEFEKVGVIELMKSYHDARCQFWNINIE